MAQERYSFFNSAVGDERSYDADALASAMRTLSMSGVGDLDGGLLVSAEGGTMRTLVAPGAAVVRGYFYELREDGGETKAFTHAAATGADRIDRIVVRLDLTARTIAMVKKEGLAAATPEAPALTRTDSVYELSIARVRVRAGATEVLPTDVTDERADESACGAALPEGVKLSTLWQRIQKSAATIDAAGMMSAQDKQRLDALHAALVPNAGDQTVDGQGYTLVNADMQLTEQTEDAPATTVKETLRDTVQRLDALTTVVDDDTRDVFVHVYDYAYDEQTSTHMLTGSGANGRVKPTRAYQLGDSMSVNGTQVTPYAGGQALQSLSADRWATFVYDAQDATVNFKQGGLADAFSWVIALSEDTMPKPSMNDYGKEAYCFLMRYAPDEVLKIHVDSIYQAPTYTVPGTVAPTTVELRCYATHTKTSRLQGVGSRLVPYKALVTWGDASPMFGANVPITAYRLKSEETADGASVTWEKLPETLPTSS